MLSVMFRKKTVAIFSMTLIALLTLIACSKGSSTGGGENEEPGDGVDEFKSDMLKNYSDNIIIPAFTDLNDKIGTLETAVHAFLDAPDQTKHNALKASFKNVYVSYQNISVAYFGPSAALLLNNYLNTFPAVPSKIEAGIQSGNYNFNLPVSSDSIQGFPTLDYLLFSENAVAKFSDANSANRKKYVRDIVSRIKALTANAQTQWTGSYRNSFITSLKTDVGSSIGALVNQFAFELDAMKGPRIGWPFGKQSNGIVFADRCEGYYSGITGDLAVANLKSLKNYFIGNSGKGISDYLVLLKKDQLNTTVVNQFETAISALQAIPQPTSEAFINNAPLVEEAYKQVQKLLTLIKTDVASATGVQITYMDNDGD
ncbi:imelysin family protein [Pollutibacter soli]|uniref:imelysin family protein n=1 Tax=Pollutibacter soli TaxID=3034157 RepID=UPI003013F3F8